jgi:redox-sensitive bicupin YhaK (pirin superfamily)
MLSRRELLMAVAPAGALLGTACAAESTASVLGSQAPEREIDAIFNPPPRHWVGDGFHVAGYFSAIPEATRKLSPFLMLDYHPPTHYEPSERARGVGVHPHRGFETVSIAWEGSIAHHDSTGAGGVIGPGDVQWMTAGAGILHKEYHEQTYGRRGGTFHMAQLWVNLPRAHKWTAPGYQPIVAAEIPEVPVSGGAGVVRVIAGDFQGITGPARTFTPMNVYDARIPAQGSVTLTFPAHQTVAMLVMKGAGWFNNVARAVENQFVLFQRKGERIAFTAEADTQLLVLNGEPIDEPVAKRGPFVMNTVDELDQAVADYRNGKFGYLAD